MTEPEKECFRVSLEFLSGDTTLAVLKVPPRLNGGGLTTHLVDVPQSALGQPRLLEQKMLDIAHAIQDQECSASERSARSV